MISAPKKNNNRKVSEVLLQKVTKTSITKNLPNYCNLPSLPPCIYWCNHISIINILNACPSKENLMFLLDISEYRCLFSVPPSAVEKLYLNDRKLGMLYAKNVFILRLKLRFTSPLLKGNYSKKVTYTVAVQCNAVRTWTEKFIYFVFKNICLVKLV